MGKLLEIISKQVFQFRCSILFPSFTSPVHSFLLSSMCVFAEHAEGRENGYIVHLIFKQVGIDIQDTRPALL